MCASCTSLTRFRFLIGRILWIFNWFQSPVLKSFSRDCFLPRRHPYLSLSLPLSQSAFSLSLIVQFFMSPRRRERERESKWEVCIRDSKWKHVEYSCTQRYFVIVRFSRQTMEIAPFAGIVLEIVYLLTGAIQPCIPLGEPRKRNWQNRDESILLCLCEYAVCCTGVHAMGNCVAMKVFYRIVSLLHFFALTTAIEELRHFMSEKKKLDTLPG